MLQYFEEQFDHLRLWVVAVFLAPGWQWVVVHWSGFWWSSPLVWISIFWAADWVLGTARACYSGWAHPEDPTMGWRPARSARSVLKLLWYVGALMLAWGLRDSAGMGGVVAAACIETGILLTEAGSVIQHMADLSGIPVLRVFATKMKSQTSTTTEGPGKPGPS